MAAINHFRARVEILLNARSMSASDLAAKLGQNRQRVIYQLERGDPKASTLQEYAAALNVDQSELLKQVSFEEYGQEFIPRMPE